MELATGPLPPRPPAASPPEHGADAWGDFLRRVLFLASPAAEDDAAAAIEAPLDDALSEPPPPPAQSGLGAGLAVE